MSFRRPIIVSVVAAIVGSMACAEPPNKEINQAQGAIDAARAAGANQYAPAEFKAATEALGRSQQAVTQRDYRLALNYALDAREQAQNAAKQAAAQRAIVRSDAERAVQTIDRALATAHTRLRAARALRIAPHELTKATATIGEADRALQEARAALARDDYLAAREATAEVADRVNATIRDLDVAIAARTVRRRR